MYEYFSSWILLRYTVVAHMGLPAIVAQLGLSAIVAQLGLPAIVAQLWFTNVAP